MIPQDFQCCRSFETSILGERPHTREGKPLDPGAWGLQEGAAHQAQVCGDLPTCPWTALSPFREQRPLPGLETRRDSVGEKTAGFPGTIKVALGAALSWRMVCRPGCPELHRHAGHGAATFLAPPWASAGFTTRLVRGPWLQLTWEQEQVSAHWPQ